MDRTRKRQIIKQIQKRIWNDFSYARYKTTKYEKEVFRNRKKGIKEFVPIGFELNKNQGFNFIASISRDKEWVKGYRTRNKRTKRKCKTNEEYLLKNFRLKRTWE